MCRFCGGLLNDMLTPNESVCILSVNSANAIRVGERRRGASTSSTSSTLTMDSSMGKGRRVSNDWAFPNARHHQHFAYNNRQLSLLLLFEFLRSHSSGCLVSLCLLCQSHLHQSPTAQLAECCLISYYFKDSTTVL